MAATAINVNRQTVLVAEREFNYEDFTSGTAKALIYLKPGTTILRGFVDVTTAFGDDTQTVTVGDTEGVDDVDRYLTSTSVASTGLTALSTPPLTDGVINTAEALTITLTSGEAATAGVGRVVIEYIEDSRETEYHTYRG